MKIAFVVCLCFALTKGFFLNTLFAECRVDSDCRGLGGCCSQEIDDILGDIIHSCTRYLLPGEKCDSNDNGHCGCMKGYTCTVRDASFLHSIALEPNTHLTMGTCLPGNGTSSGASIAVEGGR
ncbi:hypothetical protein ACJMK2_043658 [Sinanodonta woodiana]|uniref:Prokineticin domain-containing protein n=1 Tax=Sinanodonta woodiana TaxID=1069815 RepID=A0ABD3W0T6_SINWO